MMKPRLKSSDSPKELHKLLEAAERCQGDIPTLLQILQKLNEGGDDSPAVNYARAYTWYLHPGRSADLRIRSKVDELLNEVLRIVPSDYLSLLYLGHNAYDHQDYISAERHFELAKSVAPKSYIGLKSHEMALCSKIMQPATSTDVLLAELEAFAAEATSPGYAPEDIWSRELASALDRSGKLPFSDAQRDRALWAAIHLDQAGNLREWVSNLLRRH